MEELQKKKRKSRKRNENKSSVASVGIDLAISAAFSGS